MRIYPFDYHSEGVYWAEDKALTKLKTQQKEVVSSLAPTDARSKCMCCIVCTHARKSFLVAASAITSTNGRFLMSELCAATLPMLRDTLINCLRFELLELIVY